MLYMYGIGCMLFVVIVVYLVCGDVLEVVIEVLFDYLLYVIGVGCYLVFGCGVGLLNYGFVLWLFVVLCLFEVDVEED